MIEYILLGFLKKGEMSGYDIKFYMSNSTSHFYDASFGSIYPALKRMLGLGLIGVREGISEGRLKKTYFIREKGSAEFLKWLEAPVPGGRGKMEHLIKIFFYDFLPEQKASELIRGFIASTEEKIKELDELEARIAEKAGRFSISTLLFGKDYYKFTAEWYKKFLKTA
jgi:DNA-binding PadR family transcriptional regulator